MRWRLWQKVTENCMRSFITITVFWAVTLCCSVRIRRFGETYCLHLQGWSVSQARRQLKQALLSGVWREVTFALAFSQFLSGLDCACILLGLLFDSEDGGDIFNRITWRYNTEYRTCIYDCCENLSYKKRFLPFLLWVVQQRSQYWENMAWDGEMIDEFEGIWKEAVMV
jgi:hypothetical protein